MNKTLLINLLQEFMDACKGKDISPELLAIKKEIQNKEVDISKIVTLIEQRGTISKDILKTLSTIANKPKPIEPKDYSDILGFIDVKLEILKELNLNKIEILLANIKDKEQIEEIKIIDEKGKPVDWKKVFNINGLGGGSGIAGDQVTQLLAGLQKIEDKIISSPATEDKQDDIISVLDEVLTPNTSTITLTTANTAYLISSDSKTVILYNGSDTDIFLGDSTVSITNGIILSAGGTITIDTVNLYAVCGTDSKVLNILILK